MSKTSFSLDVSKWVNKAKGNTEALMRKVVFDIGSNIIMSTPVDTGRARANWITSIGSARVAVSNSTQTSDSIGHLTQGISAYRANKDTSIFITNALPYIVRLEYGHSKQAPSGMVRIAISGFQEIVKRAAGGLK